jgi:hypothetical protein
MRMMLIAFALAGFTLWDMTANRGHYTRPVYAFVSRVLTP